jgi:hypothetical protein
MERCGRRQKLQSKWNPTFQGKRASKYEIKEVKHLINECLKSLPDVQEDGTTPPRNRKAEEEGANHDPDTPVITTPQAQEEETNVLESSEGLGADGANTTSTSADSSHMEDRETITHTGAYREYDLRTIDERLESTPSRNALDGYQELFTLFTNILIQTRNYMEIPTQNHIDELYSHLHLMFKVTPRERTTSRPKPWLKSRKNSKRQKDAIHTRGHRNFIKTQVPWPDIFGKKHHG